MSPADKCDKIAIKCISNIVIPMSAGSTHSLNRHGEKIRSNNTLSTVGFLGCSLLIDF